jgi:hypothetical protein
MSDVAEAQMSPSPLPVITEADYAVIQRIIPELLNVSYGEWCEDQEKAIAYRRPRNGSVLVAISADEFAQWLVDNKTAAHLELLWVCVEEKMAGQAKS